MTACKWTPLKEEGIPKDVPKGHMVVYVGESCRRFVIEVAFLEHPLFQALLDQAREEFGFSSCDGKLCIPCDEAFFVRILRRVRSWRRRKVWCLCV
ncbi:auxin-responsive protein SAUR50 [Canna indica]|uniref:Auxin-responsive protein SAUR50 n=1 Tax=Canna indica TaxID=4628 RepID=A0AAQ3QIY8_9LILI|nr:auxin-responsive protein SAUR50 [Canna indica]